MHVISVQLQVLTHALVSASAFGVGTVCSGVSQRGGTRSMLHQAGDDVEVKLLGALSMVSERSVVSAGWRAGNVGGPRQPECA